ncbi:unnamed protein product [Rotaria sp. Silwood1]|nr:unnamed protein product [Rotaria sp. Silwood1]CAF1640589.1 unnamed protein product [Rotaria sp. Silwood1]CAF3738784.1 unnamed protein product [Rotaria sp. Silwood1]CAF3751976.1 unnamed protein product [Rotaria sp. Silwood1]CAF3822590.1 unnamed protein product [Rotaria sp. Silwood1]
MYSQLLKESLLKIDFDTQDTINFVKFLREKYAGNEKTCQVTDEFKQNYDGTSLRNGASPIWWHTRDWLIYSILNKALRNQDIGMIIKMSFFARDLHQQIQ